MSCSLAKVVGICECCRFKATTVTNEASSGKSGASDERKQDVSRQKSGNCALSNFLTSFLDAVLADSRQQQGDLLLVAVFSANASDTREDR